MGRERGSRQVLRNIKERVGRGRRGNEGRQLAPSSEPPGGSPAFPRFITSRKSAQKKEQITVPVSFGLNIEGPRRSKTILERELQGGEEKVLCTSEEMKRGTNNIVLMCLWQSLQALGSGQPYPCDPETFIVKFSKEKKNLLWTELAELCSFARNYLRLSYYHFDAFVSFKRINRGKHEACFPSH